MYYAAAKTQAVRTADQVLCRGLGERPSLTSTQGGVHQGAPSPCVDTPPWLVLSGAVVLNAVYQSGKLPAAHWTVRLQADILHGEKTGISLDEKT